MVVIDRIVDTSGKPVPMSDRDIVHVFFHELALHAGAIVQDKVDIAHGTTRVEHLDKLLNKLLPTDLSPPVKPKSEVPQEGKSSTPQSKKKRAN